MGRSAASVLPLPVGATISTFSPASTYGIASLWGGVGSPKPLSLHNLLTAGCSSSKTLDILQREKGDQPPIYLARTPITANPSKTRIPRRAQHELSASSILLLYTKK
jgi:hypothetical protein